MITIRSLLILTLVLTGFVFSNVLQLNSQEIVDAEAIPLIPRAAFFSQDPDMAVKISPNGKQISFLKPYEGVLNVWVQNIGDKQEAFPVTKSKNPIFHYRWAKNNEQILYFRDSQGDENSHIYSVDLKSFKIIDLTPFENVQARIVRGSEKYPDEIVVAINNRDPAYHDLWTINTRTGERSLVYENKEEFGELFVDHNHQLRIGRKSDGKGGYKFFVRDLVNKSWKPFIHFDKDDNSITSRILEFSSDNQHLYYLDSTNSDTAALYSSNIDSNNVQKEKIASEEKSDIVDVIFDPSTKKPRVTISKYLRIQYSILDPKIQADMKYLQNFSDGDLYLLDSSLDDQKWIVAYSYDNKPVRYYLYDRPKKTAIFLFSPNQELEKFPLTTMQPVIIKSRDGLPLISYLSIPLQGPRKNIPMVLWVHGGPLSRDEWGYNVIHQWLNNRGYAVLSVNFRGSVGFGKRFVNAGNRQWSKKMQDDLIDSVNWSIEKGIADPKKICIGGASYGGYATLVGLTSTPEIFACGVDISGDSNLQTILEEIPPYLKDELEEFDYRIGPGNDKEFLKSISPLYKVDKISKPLLIAQGRNDIRVHESQSTQIVEAMKKNHQPVIYVLFPDEGHAFVKTENDLAFYAIMEAFLAKELGGRFQKIGDDVKNSSAIILEGKELIEGL
jgi:dipeptidyl aminopeptidase/acylaminoacyl peptidase